MKILLALPLLLLAPALSAPAHAVAAQKTPAKRSAPGPAVDPKLKAEFAATDLNKDGVLTREEVAARVQRMDVGKTKMPTERANMLAAVWFARADANKDGKVTPFEMQKLFRTVASRYDTNHDGVISVEERAAAHKDLTGPSAGR